MADLNRAVEAAAEAMADTGVTDAIGYRTLARIAVEAAAPHVALNWAECEGLRQRAERAEERLLQVEGEWEDLRHRLNLMTKRAERAEDLVIKAAEKLLSCGDLLHAERALADRLAEALRKHGWHFDGNVNQPKRPKDVTVALAAYEEARRG